MSICRLNCYIDYGISPAFAVYRQSLTCTCILQKVLNLIYRLYSNSHLDAKIMTYRYDINCRDMQRIVSRMICVYAFSFNTCLNNWCLRRLKKQFKCM